RRIVAQAVQAAVIRGCWWTGFDARCYDRTELSTTEDAEDADFSVVEMFPHMKSESIAFGVAGIMFGLIAGWIIGTQQASPRAPAAVAAQAAAAPAGDSGGARAAVLDEKQVNALKSVAEREPSNVKPRVQLANLYFDAERYDDA